MRNAFRIFRRDVNENSIPNLFTRFETAVAQSCGGTGHGGSLSPAVFVCLVQYCSQY